MKLTKGKGNQEKGEGCWMIAAAMYNDEGWTDHPECVPPTLQQMCMGFNDALEDDVREETISPHLFAPMGRDKSVEAEKERAELAMETAVLYVDTPETADFFDRAEQEYRDHNYSICAAAAVRVLMAKDLTDVWLQLILDCCDIGEKPQLCEVKKAKVMEHLEKVGK